MSEETFKEYTSDNSYDIEEIPDDHWLNVASSK